MRLSLSASVLALCVALGMPAQAQQTTPSPAPGVTPGQPAQQQQGQFSMEQLNQVLEQAGIEERQEFQGKLFRAQTQDGHPVFMLIGPENLAGGESVDVEDSQVRDALQQAQMQSVQPLEDVHIARGQWEGNGVLAVSGQRNWEGQPGQATQQLSQEAIQQQLSQANIENLEPFEGSLVRTRTQQGTTLFLIIGPEDMSGGESVDVNQDQLRQSLQQANLQDVQVIEDDTHLFRGELDGNAVLAMAGNFIESPRAGIGAGGAPQPGIQQPGMRQQPGTQQPGMQQPGQQPRQR